MERRSGFRALVVEDDPAILNLVKLVLEKENFIVEGVRDGGAAISLLEKVAYDLLILDLMLPQVSGEEVLDYLELTKPESLRRVIVTTASPRKMNREFLERVCRLLTKPFDISQLILYARECAGPGCGTTAEIILTTSEVPPVIIEEPRPVIGDDTVPPIGSAARGPRYQI